jgi:hypothetical protein
MKKSIIFLFILGVFILSVGGGFAASISNSCSLQVSLVNQDPYPAVQGDTVKLLFQVSNVQNPDCNGAYFRLDPGYAFSLTQNDSVRILQGSTYTQNYNNNWAIPYTLNVNNGAPDGEASITAYYSPGSGSPTSSQGLLSQTFNVSIQNSRASFEVYVQNYDSLTNTLTFEILNTANVDAKAVTMEIPEQNNIQMKGSNVNIVGDLGSNEYTTADFSLVPTSGKINLTLSYTDIAGVRRSVNETVNYDSKFFQSTASNSNSGSAATWVVIVAIAILIGYWFYRRQKRKKALQERRMRSIK